MIPYLQIPVHEPSQVGEARRAAARLSGELRLDETAAGRVALIVTELAGNLARHAQGGRILLGCTPDGGLDVLSLDDGPGMADVGECLRDGYSSAGTPGTGLGAARRLSSVFSVFSVAGKGTVIYAGVHANPDAAEAAREPSAFCHAGINLAAPGEQVSGDGWQIRVNGRKVAVVVADGLGHGPDAAKASDAALAVFATAPAGAPSNLLERMHTALRSTRGAAVAVAELDDEIGTLKFAGSGNICGRLLSGVEDRALMSQHGTVGLQIRRPQDIGYAWPEHALLILHSDGIVTRWNFAETPGLLQCEPAVVAGWLLREHCRGRDDATVVVLRRVR